MREYYLSDNVWQRDLREFAKYDICISDVEENYRSLYDIISDVAAKIEPFPVDGDDAYEPASDIEIEELLGIQRGDKVSSL